MNEEQPSKGRKDWSEMSAGERIIGVVGLIVLVAVIVTIVIPGIQHWANASDASPAPTQEAAVATPTRTASPTRAPSPSPETAWPAEFQERFCLALIAADDLSAGMGEMIEAGINGDVSTVSLKAYSLGADAMLMDANLEMAPAWEPANQVVRDLRSGLAVIIPAADAVDNAIQTDDVATLTTGMEQIRQGLRMLTAATDDTRLMILETGFTCER